ncbi:MAG: ABC transporter permease [Lachnospiraceae bacterium]|nr:ABC transporter permease [Lachnospiraceae bacterium]MDD3617458.1 ABC transporter permease [Lachnospiraceae bacterium]
MSEKGITPNNNSYVIKLLSKELEKSSKGRNRILLGAVAMCIVTLTMVFGISYGKVQAEYTKAIREAGMTASTVYEDASEAQYEQVKGLNYIKQVGKRATGGIIELDGMSDCALQWVDENAWNEIIKPAYTDIHGSYPQKDEEIMLSFRVLNNLNIDNPKEGMEIELSVNIGLFQTEQKKFKLCGWYTDYVKDNSKENTGYISLETMQKWGYQINEKADLLICQSDNLQWQETEERLYKDVPVKDAGQTIAAANTYAYDAVNQLVGSYELAVLGAVIILGGLFFLIQNVLHMSIVADIRKLGLLNTLGATQRQLKKIYYKQMQHVLIPGVFIGWVLSSVILLLVIPQMLGKQYLQGFGGTKELTVFKPEILAAAVLSTVLLTMGVAAFVIRRVVDVSCVESMYYTGLQKKKSRKASRKQKQIRNVKRSETGELWYMAWQNVNRYRARFLLTVFSLFLGLEMFLVAIVIISGSDYVHVIEDRPDFLIAGTFSQWGQESGYGTEYKSRDAGEDPMKTEGDIFQLLYANDYEEFAPISAKVKEQLLDVSGVDKAQSYVMEGAYVLSTISAKGIRPFLDENEALQEKTETKEGVGYYGSEYEMLEGFHADVIQIIKDSEIEILRAYVEKNKLNVDMKSLDDGNGVMILHDHMLSPTQEQQAEESVGEPLYFTSLLSKEDKKIWNQKSAQERDGSVNAGQLVGKQSGIFRLCGYLDNQAKGFPDIRQTWHGAEGDIYYLISERGFKNLPTEKKTLYMELNVDQEKESQAKNEIQEIILQENQRRAQLAGMAVEDEGGEAGIFCIGKSDLLKEASAYIQGNRLILGSISAILLLAGFTNYFNVMVTGILTRKRELEIMQSIGMTKKQKRKLIMAEGGYYCFAVTALIVSLGSAVLKLVAIYMNGRLSYYEYHYPFAWTIVLAGGMCGICLAVSGFLCHKKD